MSTIQFKTTPSVLITESAKEPHILITLPKGASQKLASRSTTLVEGTINGHRFLSALEPDGLGSHWFTVGQTMGKTVGVDADKPATIEIEPIPVKEWPEPKVPADLKKALEADPKVHALWADITPMARWDWVRWTDTVKLVETRRDRPKKLISMLNSGKRRPCCFDRAARTPPKSAELL